MRTSLTVTIAPPKAAMPRLRMISERSRCTSRATFNCLVLAGLSIYLDDKVILLTLLRQDVLPVDDVGLGQLIIDVRDLVLVQAEAVLLDHLAGLALGGEDLRAHSQRVQDAEREVASRNLESRHAVEDGQERPLVERAQVLGSGLAEEHLRRTHGVVELRLPVHHDRDLAGQQALQLAALGRLAVRRDRRLDRSTVQHREDLDEALRVLVADVQPELVELVRGGALRVEPDVALLGLAELGAVGLLDQRAGQREGLAAVHAADELRARGDVAPLVGAAQLQDAAAVLPEPVEIIALHQLVAEFGEGHALGGVARKALLHGVLRHHIIDGDGLADVADEVDEGVVLHPVVVVHELRLVGGVGVEVEEMRQLGLDARHVVRERCLVEQVALLALHRRVADHAGGAADQRERLVAAVLEMLQDHHAHQVPDVQGVRRRVDSDVRRLRAFHQFLFRSRHDILDHAAPFQLFNKILHRLHTKKSANLVNLRVEINLSTNMRKKIVAGNWKMNTTRPDGIELAKAVAARAAEVPAGVGLIIAPPFTHLCGCGKALEGSKVELSAQNCADHAKGAYTGEISVDMLKAVGCQWTILGHSERRQYYGETDEKLVEKVKLALEAGLGVILCVGENLDERKAGKHLAICASQTEAVLKNFTAEDMKKIVIAYEPVWAIGTGETATPAQAEEIHAHIRKVLAGLFNQAVADDTTILYGGSCKPSNAKELFAQPDIDGGLIGGAALKADDFIQIALSF